RQLGPDRTDHRPEVTHPAQQRLAAMEDERDVVLVVGSAVLHDAPTRLPHGLDAHELGLLAPAPIILVVHEAVRTVEITAARHLEYVGMERDDHRPLTNRARSEHEANTAQRSSTGRVGPK